MTAVSIVAFASSNGDPASATPRRRSAPLIRLADQVPPALSQGSLRPVPAAASAASQQLSLTLTLKRTDEAGFQQFLAAVQDPSSPSYRHFVTPARLADRFGPSRGAYESVRGWLRAQGLTPGQESADRLTLGANGMRGRVAQAFHVEIVDYSIGGHPYYGPKADPQVPASIAGVIQSVAGLSNVTAPAVPNGDKVPAECLVFQEIGGASLSGLTFITVLEGIAAYLAIFVPILFILGATLAVLAIGSGLYCLGAIAGGRRGTSFGPSSPAAGLAPSRSRTPQAAQGAAPRAPAGAAQKIGLLEYDTYRPSDVTDWLRVGGADPSIAGRLSQVSVNGGVSTPGTGESEVLLDIATVMQLIPNPPTKYVVYSAPATTSFEAMFNAMINDGDTVISNSWSACEDQVSSAEARAIDSVLAQAAAAGISVVNGAGDKGSTCLDGSANTVGVPADSPHATAVGGTSAKALVGGLYNGETWWNGSNSTPPTGQGGFGVSKYFARPSYQTGLTSSPMRSIPDLAAIADPVDGVQICQSDAGGCPSGLSYGGTSMSAPEVAAQIADINSQVGSNIGELNPALYPFGGTPAFESPAKMGSDFAHVGLGSPDLAHLVMALKGIVAGPADPNASKAASSATTPADGKAAALVDAFLTGANGAPVSGKAVAVSASSPTAVVTAINGTSAIDGGSVSFAITDSVPEKVTFTVTDTTDGIALTTRPAITFVPPSATGAAISASPPSVPNDGASKATVTVYLQNGLGRPASGKSVSLSAGGSSAVISPAGAQAVTDTAGTATFTATDTSQESVIFTAIDVTDGNLPVPGSAEVNFGPTSNTCPDVVPTATSGNSVSQFVTGLAFNPQTIVYPGNFTVSGCTGQSPPAFDANGNAYVADATDGSIHVFGPSGGTANAANKLPNANFPGGSLANLAFGKDGSLYAALTQSGGSVRNPEIVQIDPTTGATIRVVASTATGLPDCPSVATDPLSGDLFTDDSCSGFAASNQISRISNLNSPTPVVSAYVTTGGGNVGFGFAPDGTLYLADAATCAIDQVGGTNTPSPTITPLVSVPCGRPGIPSGVTVAIANSAGHATTLLVDSFGGTLSSVDLTQSPPSVTTIAANEQDFYYLGAANANGCGYAPLPGNIFRFGPSTCGSSTTSTGPQITLSGVGLSSPPTGTPVTFTATLANVAAPAGTPIHFSVSGANTQPKLVNADANGKATFTYSGVFPGTDTVTAFAVINGKTVTSVPVAFRWVAGKDTTFISLNQSQGGGPIAQAARLTANLADVAKSPPTPIADAPVTITLGSQSCAATTDSSGNGTCTLTPPGPPGLIPVTASYAGTSLYTPATATDSFAVSAATGGQAPAITSPASTTFTVGAPGSFTVAATGTPTPTLAETGPLPAGVSFNPATGLLAGTPGAGTVAGYPITFTATNAVPPDATQLFILNVIKAESTTTVAAAPPDAGLGSPVTFTASVTAASANTLSPSGTVGFFVDGEATAVATVVLVAGKARLTTSALGAGSHNVVATYNGDANFAASTTTTAVAETVRCTTTVIGAHPGALVVSAGTACVVGAQIGGSVIVAKGASIDIENSTIGGALSTGGGPGALRICASTTTGAVSVQRTTGLVIIGDPGDAACQPNTIAGALNLQNNTGGVEAINNTVARLIASNNSGPGPYPGDPTTITGNHP